MINYTIFHKSKSDSWILVVEYSEESVPIIVLFAVYFLFLFELFEVALFAEDACAAAQAGEHQEFDLDSASLAVLIESQIGEATLFEVARLCRANAFVVELVEQVTDFGIPQNGLLVGECV